MTSGYDIQNEHYDDINKYSVDFMQACGAVDIPDVMDPRDWYKIENQSVLSSCVGNAETGPIEVSYRNATGQIAQFSRMDAYLASQRYSDMIQPGQRYFGRDGGALIAGARRAAMERGCCLESTFPYPQQYSTRVPQGAEAEANTFKMLSSSIIGPNDPDPFTAARQYIGAGVGGILFGAPWPFNMTNDFKVTNFRSYGNQGHAMCILGYLKDLLIGVNSHSKSFADQGFYYFTRQGFNEMVRVRNTVVVGLSDLSVPRGRKVDWSKESMFA